MKVPTINRRSRKRHWKVIKWLRDDRGRLIRLVSPAEVLDNDIIMLDVQTVQRNLSLSSYIGNQPFHEIHPENLQDHHFNTARDKQKAKEPHSITKSNIRKTEYSLMSLPTELIEYIIQFLDVTSVENLSLMNRRLKDIVMSNYYIHLMLPCHPDLLEKLIKTKKKVLRLTSNCCLKLLQDPVTGELKFWQLNLSALKVLQFCGSNYSVISRRNDSVCLSDLYYSCLEKILSSVNPTSLQRIELVTDTSDNMAKRVAPYLKTFSRLETLALQGKSALLARSHVPGNEQVITCLIEASHARKIELNKFESMEASKEVRIDAPWLTCVQLDLGKTPRLRLGRMTCLTQMIVSENVFHCNCLVHYSDGLVFKDLIAGAPNLRFFNEVDLNILIANDVSYCEDNAMKEGFSVGHKKWFSCSLLRREQEFHNLSWELKYRKERGVYKKNLFPGYDFKYTKAKEGNTEMKGTNGIYPYISDGGCLQYGQYF